MRQAATAVCLVWKVLMRATIFIAKRLLGFIQAVIAGAAVLNRFQSKLREIFKDLISFL